MDNEKFDISIEFKKFGFVYREPDEKMKQHPKYKLAESFDNDKVMNQDEVDADLRELKE